MRAYGEPLRRISDSTAGKVITEQSGKSSQPELSVSGEKLNLRWRQFHGTQNVLWQQKL